MGKEYTVKNRDTLFKIAQQELGTGSDFLKIAELNGIEHPYTIHAGQKITTPILSNQDEGLRPSSPIQKELLLSVLDTISTIKTD
ncbi:MAG: hypothetical protein ChlgKO_14010 [Chlamydiales bacterium]